MSQELTTCADCGMPVAANEYHPFAACLMFKACHNSDTVRANLAAVMERAQHAGEAKPIGHVYTMEALVPGASRKYHAQLYVDLPAGTKLYAEPPAATNQAGIPEGRMLVQVREETFDALMHALDRAEDKGYLPDAIAEEWQAFDYVVLAAAPTESRALGGGDGSI